ncbi:MAG: uroporphyrinogen-III synthase [Bellilinea sp.]
MNKLTGKRVLVTRPRAQAAALIDRLTALGAEPVVFPTIEISSLEDTSRIDQAINQLNAYQWVIFTSVNGVSAFWQRLTALGKGNDAFAGSKVAAIGPATAQALMEKGVQPTFVPDEYVAEAILPGLGDVRGLRVLLPLAEIARKALVDALQNHGAIPEEIAIYRTLPPHPDSQALAELEKGVDIATFTSSSTVQNFFALLGGRASDLLKGAVIACIGPITAETAQKLGLAVDIVPKDYTVEGLVEALLNADPKNSARNIP